MVIHKRTRLTPIQREEIYRVYHEEGKKVSDLAESYHVSRPTITRSSDAADSVIFRFIKVPTSDSAV